MMTDRNVSLSVSIVTYRTDPKVLADALNSLTGDKLTKSIYIVDNSPSDNLGSLAARHHAAYIHTGENIGFGRAHNIALRQIQANSKYHLILNPDVSFGPSVLDDIFELMEMNPGIGWVMPQVLYPNGVSQDLCKRLPAPWDLAIR
jgi:GT2 family glycosyltransferase